MAKITRYNGNVKAFAIDAPGNERTIFNDNSQSDSLDDNINPDYLRGFGIYGANDFPTREDFNGFGYTLGQLTSYSYQYGVPEWNSLQEFNLNSITNRNGKISISITDNNIGFDPDVTGGGMFNNWIKSSSDLSIALNAFSSATSLDGVNFVHLNAALQRLQVVNLNTATNTLSLVGSPHFITGASSGLTVVGKISETRMSLMDNSGVRVYDVNVAGGTFTEVGTQFSIVTTPGTDLSLTYIDDFNSSGNDYIVAFIAELNQIKLISLNGTTFTDEGSIYATPGVSVGAVERISQNRIAFLSNSDNEIIALDMNLSSELLEQVGTPFDTTLFVGVSEMSSCSDNSTFAYSSSTNQATALVFSSLAWSLQGDILDLAALESSDVVGMACLGGGNVAFLDDINDKMFVYQNQNSAAWRSIEASEISYDGASSGIPFDNVQEAIDKVATDIDNITTNVDNLTTDVDDINIEIDNIEEDLIKKSRVSSPSTLATTSYADNVIALSGTILASKSLSFSFEQSVNHKVFAAVIDEGVAGQVKVQAFELLGSDIAAYPARSGVLPLTATTVNKQNSSAIECMGNKPTALNTFVFARTYINDAGQVTLSSIEFNNLNGTWAAESTPIVVNSSMSISTIVVLDKGRIAIVSSPVVGDGEISIYDYDFGVEDWTQVGSTFVDHGLLNTSSTDSGNHATALNSTDICVVGTGIATGTELKVFRFDGSTFSLISTDNLDLDDFGNGYISISAINDIDICVLHSNSGSAGDSPFITFARVTTFRYTDNEFSLSSFDYIALDLGNIRSGHKMLSGTDFYASDEGNSNIKAFRFETLKQTPHNDFYE